MAKVAALPNTGETAGEGKSFSKAGWDGPWELAVDFSGNGYHILNAFLFLSNKGQFRNQSDGNDFRIVLASIRQM